MLELEAGETGAVWAIAGVYRDAGTHPAAGGFPPGVSFRVPDCVWMPRKPR
jgi:hypothetical protein